MSQQQLSAAQQIEQINQQLTQALIRKEELTSRLEVENKNIIALRNVISGIQVGQQFAAEQVALQQAVESPTK